MKIARIAMLLAVSILPVKTSAEIVISALYQRGKLLFEVNGKTMLSSVFYEKHSSSVLSRSKNEPVFIVFDNQCPIGQISEVRGLIGKIGIEDVKYYITSEDKTAAVELQFKGPVIANPAIASRPQ